MAPREQTGIFRTMSAMSSPSFLKPHPSHEDKTFNLSMENRILNFELDSPILLYIIGKETEITI